MIVSNDFLHSLASVSDGLDTRSPRSTFCMSARLPCNAKDRLTWVEEHGPFVVNFIDSRQLDHSNDSTSVIRKILPV